MSTTNPTQGPGTGSPRPGLRGLSLALKCPKPLMDECWTRKVRACLSASQGPTYKGRVIHSTLLRERL